MGKNDFDELDELIDSLKGEVEEGFEIDIECPTCEKDINIVTNKDGIYKCPICGEEFELNLESK